MKRYRIIGGVSVALLLVTAVINEPWFSSGNNECSQVLSEASPSGRAEYEFERLKDPATGKIPSNIRMRELAFASTLPINTPSARTAQMTVDISSVGPYNVGGRTRAFAIDLANPTTYMAGGVSGGLWKSEDAGDSWFRVTTRESHAAVSCISQDTRTAKNETWYYGSGEVVGNSASKSFSAWYRGSGIYKSTDNGDTWSLLPSTAAMIQSASDWDAVFRVLVDPVRLDSDIVLTAISEGIMRSNDGGSSWVNVLDAFNATFTDLAVTSSGVFYATIGSNGGTQNKGFWRSPDGLNWTKITPTGFPGTHTRTVMAIYPGNESVVYFLSTTPGSGNIGNSLWKYTYLSGDGSGTGGNWENRTDGLPNHDLDLNNGYSQVVAVKPDDEDIVFVGGTNLYRSTNGFADTLLTKHIGGYEVEWDENYSYRSGVHYPDQQRIVFHPYDPDMMISTTDGGIHRTKDCGAAEFVWESLSNGYVTSQFYGIAIDHTTSGSKQIIGGLQDRGTFWTNDADPEEPWVSVRGSDGAFVWIEDGGEHQYSSTQYANVRRNSIDANGNYGQWKRVIPQSWGGGGGNGWLFVHPFTIDEVDNDIMYLPQGSLIWRNDNLPAIDNEDLTDWEEIADLSGTITAIAASKSPQGVLYAGTSNRIIYRMEGAHTGSNLSSEIISQDISSGSYTSCIAVDPNDADRVVVVYSNYSVISLWYTEDGGGSWTPIEGNLAGTPEPNVPEELYYISDGPSIRWFEFAETEDGYAYFVGTSIGLFSTRELNGDSTVWVQEGAETIGNVVVDMLDYRSVDQWLVAGTHGNGIFAGNLSFEPEVIDTSTSVFSVDTKSRVSVYPNPAQNLIHISVPNSAGSKVLLELYDQSGRLSMTTSFSGQTGQMRVDELPKGVYFLRTEVNARAHFVKVVLE